MPGGEFDASPEFCLDPLRTAVEIQRCGVEVLAWLERLASSESPRSVDHFLVEEIHRRWFESTFPADAGTQRMVMVFNRKGTAVPVEAILPAVQQACDNWTWRREHVALEDEAEQIAFTVTEANALTVRIYDAHPFVDGNTRATWHLRNYVLMLGGLRPLGDPADEPAYDAAWWTATTQDHEELDRIVLEELARQDR